MRHLETTYTVVDNRTGKELGTVTAKGTTAAFNKAYRLFPSIPRCNIGLIEQ